VCLPSKIPYIGNRIFKHIRLLWQKEIPTPRLE